MEEKFTRQENILNETLEKIKKDFKERIIEARKRGKLTWEELILFRKDMEKIMGDIANQTEMDRIEK